MLRSLLDDALELFGLDVAVTVLVEVEEGLTDTLALQATKHLRELLVCHVVPLLLPANVERSPLAVPVEREAVVTFVQVVQAEEVVELDASRALDIEEPEGDLVLGVWLRKEVLEDGPIVEGDSASVTPVGDAEENGIL